MRLGSVRYGELRRSGLVVVWFGVVRWVKAVGARFVQV